MLSINKFSDLLCNVLEFFFYCVFQEKKTECDEDYLQPDHQQVAGSFRLEMLDLAYMCYKSASQCVDEESEEWLTDYMMGKCLEKMHKAPKEYLNYYKQVCCQIIPMIFI